MIQITHINYEKTQAFSDFSSKATFIGPAISYSYFSSPELDLTIEADQMFELNQAALWSFLNLVKTIEDNLGQHILSQEDHSIAKAIIEQTINSEWSNITNNKFPLHLLRLRRYHQPNTLQVLRHP